MSIQELDQIHTMIPNTIFPDHSEASPDGLLAAGGEVTPEWLVMAYSYGVFPWYNEPDPVLWWSPDPRALLYPEDLKVSKSLKKVIRNKEFKVTCDQKFEEVMRACMTAKRKNEEGTWINEKMIAGYCGLHEAGLAHSFECWKDNELVGGLYGVSLGKVFCGESMFSKVSNASKVALYHLCEFALQHEFKFVDCQIQNPHLESLGAVEVARERFLLELNIGMSFDTLQHTWEVKS